jgi:hypothetical protein
MLYLAIDQHRKQLTVNLRNEQGDVLVRRQVSTEWPRVRSFLEEVREMSVLEEGFVVILEVCGFNDWLLKLLTEHGCRQGQRLGHKLHRADAVALGAIGPAAALPKAAEEFASYDVAKIMRLPVALRGALEQPPVASVELHRVFHQGIEVVTTIEPIEALDCRSQVLSHQPRIVAGVKHQFAEALVRLLVVAHLEFGVPLLSLRGEIGRLRGRQRAGHEHRQEQNTA